MWKVALLLLCSMLTLRGSAKAAPLRPEEKWKPLDNPRNRDLFFRTLQAYFSGRGLDLRKFLDTVSVNNDRPRPVAIYSDPTASAFADYEEKKKNVSKLLQRLKEAADHGGEVCMAVKIGPTGFYLLKYK